MKPFDLSEATKLSLVLSASQHINHQQLKDSFMKNFGRYSTSDFDDNDSRFSFSSSSSPVHVRKIFSCLNLINLFGCKFQNGNNDRDSIDTTSEYFDKGAEDIHKSLETSPLGVQVISSSGGHIIAVANPALALSPTFTDTISHIKREVVSPDI